MAGSETRLVCRPCYCWRRLHCRQRATRLCILPIDRSVANARASRVTMRSTAHIVEDLCFEIDFASEDEAFEAQERVVRFAQGRAQEVMAEVFDEVIGEDVFLRLQQLEVDVGTVRMEEFEDRFAERLREDLKRLLRERRGEIDSCASSDLPSSSELSQTPGPPTGSDLSLGSQLSRRSDLLPTSKLLERANPSPRPDVATRLEFPPMPELLPSPALSLPSEWDMDRGSAMQFGRHVRPNPYPARESATAPRDSSATGRNTSRYHSMAAQLAALTESVPGPVDSLTTGAQAELEWLLHIKEYGFLPWNAPTHLSRELQPLATREQKAKRTRQTHALQSAPNVLRRMMFRRLIAQFPADWLATLAATRTTAATTASAPAAAAAPTSALASTHTSAPSVAPVTASIIAHAASTTDAPTSNHAAVAAAEHAAA